MTLVEGFEFVLVVGADILVRVARGERARALIEAHAECVSLFVPQVAYPRLRNMWRRSSSSDGAPEKATSFLRSLRNLVVLIVTGVYGEFEAEARRRLATRDLVDWPILASALALGCPIWTGSCLGNTISGRLTTSFRIRLVPQIAKRRDNSGCGVCAAA